MGFQNRSVTNDEERNAKTDLQQDEAVRDAVHPISACLNRNTFGSLFHILEIKDYYCIHEHTLSLTLCD